ncbi:MAG TPA: hypothetical protein VJP79_05335 [Nitrososphaera sp.]|nr:hypothetical protein [Nitrososphaera sp.]
MKRKTNAKGKKRQMAGASKLKTTRRKSTSTAASKGGRKTSRKSSATITKKRRPASAAKAKSASAAPVRKVVRIMGHGQFTVDGKTLKKLNVLDNSIVEFVSQERSDDGEFRKKLAELTEMVVRNSKPLDPKEIIQSDIILPSADLSIDEAKRLFKGEGVIPEI